MTSFVLSVRDTNPEGRFSTGLGNPSYLAVPDGADEPLPGHALGEARVWLEAVVAGAGPEGRPVVFFVHGYNTDPAESLRRQRLIEQELIRRGFGCQVIGFDWPTAGTAVAYGYDRLEAHQAALSLVVDGILPFAGFQSAHCPVAVHLLAHSMGGFVLREAFRAADRSRRDGLGNRWKVGQLVLFAADLSSACFAADSPDLEPVFAHCGRLTNYFSGYDEALAVSNVKHLDISARVGRVGMPTRTPANAKAVDVDCGPRYLAVPDRRFQVIDGLVSHSWYLEDPRWYDDLAHTLRGTLDRALIPGRQQVGENDFVLLES
jgi:pimeloyl-ACP methyl ester carboxylesterase